MPKFVRYRGRVLPDILTPRLQLTPVEEDDLDFMRDLNADEAVMRNLTGSPASREETHAEWSQRLHERSDRERGLGYWIGRSEGDLVGWWGLGACSWDQTTANLGYRLRPTHWGKGLATEGSAALLAHAFGTVGLGSVWASTTRHNAASHRVLAKVAMRYVGIRFDQSQYEVSARDWMMNAPPLTV